MKLSEEEEEALSLGGVRDGREKHGSLQSSHSQLIDLVFSNSRVTQCSKKQAWNMGIACTARAMGLWIVCIKGGVGMRSWARLCMPEPPPGRAALLLTWSPFLHTNSRKPCVFV